MTTPIIFIHGAFCGGWAFDQFRKPFEAAGFETHAPNLPHHERGGDQEVLARTGVREYAEAITHYVRQLEQPPVLIGHSLGGLVAQLTAMRVPPAALVLIGSSAPWGVLPTTLDEHGNSFGLTLLGDYWRRTVAPDYEVARKTTLDRLSREDARRAFGRFVHESGRAVFETVHWWLDHGMHSAAPSYRIGAPILGVARGKDRVNPSSTMRRMLNRFPQHQTTFVEMPQMSHWLIGEPEWPEVAERALSFLGEQGITPRIRPKAKRKALKLFGASHPAG